MAAICFMGSCHPALVGVDTPKGVYQLKHYATTKKGYGGDILVFNETDDSAMAIHRVLSLPGEHRPERLASGDAKQRVSVTHGCINITPVVYKALVDCCSNSNLVIK